MENFGLKKLLKAKSNSDIKDEEEIAPSEVTSDTDDHETPPSSETNAPIEDTELEDRNELFGSRKEIENDDDDKNAIVEAKAKSLCVCLNHKPT